MDSLSSSVASKVSSASCREVTCKQYWTYGCLKNVCTVRTAFTKYCSYTLGRMRTIPWTALGLACSHACIRYFVVSGLHFTVVLLVLLAKSTHTPCQWPCVCSCCSDLECFLCETHCQYACDGAVIHRRLSCQHCCIILACMPVLVPIAPFWLGSSQHNQLHMHCCLEYTANPRSREYQLTTNLKLLQVATLVTCSTHK